MRTEMMGPRENRRYFNNICLVFELCITYSNIKYKIITANVKCFVICQAHLNNPRNTRLGVMFHYSWKNGSKTDFEGPGVFSKLGFKGKQEEPPMAFDPSAFEELTCQDNVGWFGRKAGRGRTAGSEVITQISGSSYSWPIGNRAG